MAASRGRLFYPGDLLQRSACIPGQEAKRLHPGTGRRSVRVRALPGASHGGREVVKKTLYQILGVDPKASTEDIAAAFQRLTRTTDTQWPDANMPGLLRQANEILTDRERRAA